MYCSFKSNRQAIVEEKDKKKIENYIKRYMNAIIYNIQVCSPE